MIKSDTENGSKLHSNGYSNDRNHRFNSNHIIRKVDDVTNHLVKVTLIFKQENLEYEWRLIKIN